MIQADETPVRVTKENRTKDASAIIYSIAETAKANNLKPYDYFKYLLTEIPKRMDDYGTSFCEELLPWSPSLPEKCRKQL